MRVCHVTPSLLLEHGGPAVVAIQLANAQASLGAAVTIVSRRWDDNQMLAAEVDPRVAVECVPPGGRKVFFSHRQRRLLDSLSRQDVLHLHGLWEPAILASARWAQKCRIPYVIAPHGMLNAYSLSQKAWKKRLLLAAVYRRVVSGAAAVHVLTATEREAVSQVVSHALVEVLPNGISTELLERSRGPAIHRRRHSRPFWLFLGRLHHIKGLDVLLAAYRKAIDHGLDHDLLIAGPDGGYEMTLRQRVTAASLQERVRLIGAVSGSAKQALLQDAFALVHPSRHECFSITILEAMTAHRPVIISDCCSFPEIAAEGAGYVVPLNADSLATAMLSLAADEHAAEQMGCRGRALVERKYAWHIIAPKSLELYDKITSAEPRRNCATQHPARDEATAIS